MKLLILGVVLLLSACKPQGPCILVYSEPAQMKNLSYYSEACKDSTGRLWYFDPETPDKLGDTIYF
jgi:hypothetical protein